MAMLNNQMENLNLTQGFEHVKGYAGLFAAGKPRVCSEHVVQIDDTADIPNLGQLFQSRKGLLRLVKV